MRRLVSKDIASLYNSKLKNEEVDGLFEAILTLRDMDDCYRFFEDLCTINEIAALAQRMNVAKQLQTGRTYVAIAEETGASTATISRVSRCWVYGAGGYKRVLERLKEQEEAQKEGETVNGADNG